MVLARWQKHNQIDFITVDERFQTGTNRPKTRAFKRPDIGSDHDPVMVKRARFDLEKQEQRNFAPISN